MKKRRLNADERWLLASVQRARTSYAELCLAWASERGTGGNVVMWPKPIVSRAMKELLDRGLISYTPPCRQQSGLGRA
jgi:hypothetical protein